jgi:hypothetical protein
MRRLRPRGPLSVLENEHLTRYGTLHVWPAKYAGHNQLFGSLRDESDHERPRVSNCLVRCCHPPSRYHGVKKARCVVSQSANLVAAPLNSWIVSMTRSSNSGGSAAGLLATGACSFLTDANVQIGAEPGSFASGFLPACGERAPTGGKPPQRTVFPGASFRNGTLGIVGEEVWR